MGNTNPEDGLGYLGDAVDVANILSSPIAGILNYYAKYRESKDAKALQKNRHVLGMCSSICGIIESIYDQHRVSDLKSELEMDEFDHALLYEWASSQKLDWFIPAKNETILKGIKGSATCSKIVSFYSQVSVMNNYCHIIEKNGSDNIRNIIVLKKHLQQYGRILKSGHNLLDTMILSEIIETDSKISALRRKGIKTKNSESRKHINGEIRMRKEKISHNTDRTSPLCR